MGACVSTSQRWTSASLVERLSDPIALRKHGIPLFVVRHSEIPVWEHIRKEAESSRPFSLLAMRNVILQVMMVHDRRQILAGTEFYTDGGLRVRWVSGDVIVDGKCTLCAHCLTR